MDIQDTLHYCVFDVVYTVKDNPNKRMSATSSIHRHDKMCYKTEDGHLNIYLSSGINTLPNSMFTYSTSFNIQVMINSLPMIYNYMKFLTCEISFLNHPAYVAQMNLDITIQ